MQPLSVVCWHKLGWPGHQKNDLPPSCKFQKINSEFRVSIISGLESWTGILDWRWSTGVSNQKNISVPNVRRD